MSDQPDDEVVTVTPAPVTIRRAPKYSAFILVGAVVGVIVTLVLTSLFDADPTVGFLALFGYFALFGVTGGALVGAVCALVLDRLSSRRQRSVRADHTVVEPGPIDGELFD
jgi:hypothetical protein